MSEAMRFGYPEKIEVRQEEGEAAAFYVSTRDGWDNLGRELSLVVDNYRVGTVLMLHEPLPDHRQTNSA